MFCDGGVNYLKCTIYDDPLGVRQNKSFTLECISAGNSSSDYRMINSYYVHTWKSLSIDVSVGVSSNQEVSLNIDPSLENKSWQLYNYVTFDF